MTRLRVLCLFGAALICLGLGACGSGSPSPSGGGVGQFETEGGDNSIEEFGSEGSGSEFDEAATVLHDYLDACAERAWGAACGYLAERVTKELRRQFGEGGGGPSCAELLAGLSRGLPDAALREAAVADVGALRVEGERGFLLFHGAGSTRPPNCEFAADYARSNNWEGGESGRARA